MKTKYNYRDFQIVGLREYESGKDIVFGSSKITHYFSTVIKDGIITIKPTSNNTDFEECRTIRLISSYIDAINWSMDNEPASYRDSVIKFDSVDKANVFLEQLFKFAVIDNPTFYHISSTGLALGRLREGLLMLMDHDKGFKIVEFDKGFNLKEVDFREEYNKLFDPKEHLHKWNFNTMSIEPNLENKTWVLN